MKRDARIGLAVVLVLGLSVTLLIGRALYKRSPQAANEGDAELAGGDSSGTESARGPDVADNPAPANTSSSSGPGSNSAGQIPTPARETATRPPVEQPASNPAVDRFVADQTRRIEPQPAPAPSAGVPSPNNSSNGGNHPIAGNPPPPPDLLRDHEDSGPPSDVPLPADGFGYTVAGGDNPWKIAAKVYGDGKYTQKIVEANPGVNVKNMKVGTVIKIPIITNKSILVKLPSFAEASRASHGGGDNSAVAHQGPPSAPPVAERHVEAPETHTAATTHKIESGETLSVIAKKYYGVSGPKTIARIVAANNGLDASKLKVGQ